MIYLVFESKITASKALDVINYNMHFPKDGVNAKTGEIESKKGIATKWANLELRKDGCFCFPKPDDKYMKGVEDAKKEEYKRGWFPEPPLEDHEDI